MTMPAAAIYARFSSDLQDDNSIDDQVAVCRAYAERNGYQVVAIYDDRAISGATFTARAGLQRLLGDLPSRKFSAVVTESLSRISRDQADTHAIGREIAYHDCKLITLGDGEVTSMVRGLRAIINEQYIADLKVHTRRGQCTNITDGLSAGGVLYGYDKLPGVEVAGRKQVRRGKRAINEAQAAVVRRIFARYIAGDSPLQIATDLNADRIPAPRGQEWRYNTIGGNGRRGNGILQNELYVGVLVWNRLRMVRHPGRRKRVSRVNPESEWMRVAVPELAIIDRETWQAAQQRRMTRTFAHPRDRVKAVRMLSGLIRCGACGAGMPSIGEDKSGKARVRCAAVEKSGTCTHGRRYYLPVIERKVVDGLRRHLGSRAAIELYVHTFAEEWERLTHASAGQRPDLERRIAAVEREIARTVQFGIKGVLSEEELGGALPPLRAERAGLAAELANLETPAPTVCPASVAGYLSDLDRIDEVIHTRLANGHQEVTHALRQLVERVTVMPTPAGEDPVIKIAGYLDALTAAGDASKRGRATKVYPPLKRLPFSFDLPSLSVSP